MPYMYTAIHMYVRTYMYMHTCTHIRVLSPWMAGYISLPRDFVSPPNFPSKVQEGAYPIPIATSFHPLGLPMWPISQANSPLLPPQEIFQVKTSTCMTHTHIYMICTHAHMHTHTHLHHAHIVHPEST